METLEKLIGLGFSPVLAAVIVGLIVLWGTLCTVVVFMYRSQIRERIDRDRLREKWHAEIDERLENSETKHQECEKDRLMLRVEIASVKTDLGRVRNCPRQNCPLRLPG